jgi:heme-degrading monooxygenase HmoA
MKPEYAVIFTSQRSLDFNEEYSAASARMMELAQQQPGFVSADSVRGSDGLGITVSYWTSLAAIAQWKSQSEHLAVQKLGLQKWYLSYSIKVCRIERER